MSEDNNINKEDKFMWPDNMETFDINGIFPN